MLLFNDCGVIELDIASELYSIERFDHVDLCQLEVNNSTIIDIAIVFTMKPSIVVSGEDNHFCSLTSFSVYLTSR